MAAISVRWQQRYRFDRSGRLALVRKSGSRIILTHDRDKLVKISNRSGYIELKYEGRYLVKISDMVGRNMHVIDIVLKAMQESGVAPKVEPIRGGTDGAQLSFRGLPCPNIFAGGVNFHGPHEFVSIGLWKKLSK